MVGEFKAILWDDPEGEFVVINGRWVGWICIGQINLGRENVVEIVFVDDPDWIFFFLFFLNETVVRLCLYCLWI